MRLQIARLSPRDENGQEKSYFPSIYFFIFVSYFESQEKRTEKFKNRIKSVTGNSVSCPYLLDLILGQEILFVTFLFPEKDS